MNRVVHESERRRFVLFTTQESGEEVEGSYVEYMITDTLLDLQHTVSKPEFRGRGFAAIVVKAAFDWARENNRKVVPTCTYIATFVRKNPEYEYMLFNKSAV